MNFISTAKQVGMILCLCLTLVFIPHRAQASIIDEKNAEIAELESQIEYETEMIDEINQAIATANIEPHNFRNLVMMSDSLESHEMKTVASTVETYDEEVELLNVELLKYQSQLCNDTARLEQLETEVNDFGACVIAYAAQFEGNKYVWGGTDLENGIDCSGFVMRVYEEFGYELPHSSAAQQSVGYAVSVDEMELGDIVCYPGHVGLYAGDGQIINASNSAPYPRGGIKYSDVNYSKIVAVRRLE